MNEYVYIFKDKYIDKLKEEYKKVYDYISYEDIKNMSDKYSMFIRKLMLLVIDDDRLKKYNLRELLYSSNILDRLKALKESKEYIKLIGLENAYKKRN